MNIKVKFTLIIVVTLLIGIAIGFEISEISIKSRFQKMDRFREPGGFIEKFESIIQPNAEQKPAVYSILLRYHKLIDSTSKVGITQVTKLLDSMKVELKKNLKDDQYERLDRETRMLKNTPPPMDGGPKGGPNGDRGPGPNMNRDNRPPDFGPGRDNRQGPPPIPQGNKLLRSQGDNPQRQNN